MLNIIELQEDLIGMNRRPPAVFPAIVSQYAFYLQIMSFVKGQDSIIEDIHSSLRKLRSVQLAKGKGAVGIHDGLKIDPSDALQGADQEGILAEEIAWVRALHPSFAEAGIGFLQKLDLFRRKLYILAVLYLLKAKEPLIASFQIVLEPDITNRAGTHGHTV